MIVAIILFLFVFVIWCSLRAASIYDEQMEEFFKEEERNVR